MKKKLLIMLLAATLASGGIFAQGSEAVQTEAEIPLTETETEKQLNETETGEQKRVGIISALDNEIELLLDNADIDHTDVVGELVFYVGKLCGQQVVIVKAGVGKVRAAAGAAVLLNNYDLSAVIFTGIAGAVSDQTSVHDMVVATDLVQHDYGMITDDGFEWTGASLGVEAYYPCDESLVELAKECAASVVGEEHVFTGTIATGDQFVASGEYVKTLQEQFDAIACEMEGAAVAIVCTEFDVPFVVIRSMSDNANGIAHLIFKIMGDDAADNSGRTVMLMLEHLND